MWETLLKMERFDSRAGSIWCLVWPRHLSGSVSQWCGRRFFSRYILRALCANFEHQRRVQFEGCVAEPLQTITAILFGSKWSCLLLRVVLQDALSEVMKVYPPLNLRVFVDDITAFMQGQHKDLPSLAEKVLKSIRREKRRV